MIDRSILYTEEQNLISYFCFPLCFPGFAILYTRGWVKGWILKELKGQRSENMTFGCENGKEGQIN